jgi:hypothetical protein
MPKPRVVKKFSLPLIVRRLIGCKRGRAAISVNIKGLQLQARAAAGYDVRFIGWNQGSELVAWGHFLRSCSMAFSIRCQTMSSRFAVVVPQDATESLAARYPTGCTSDFLTWVDQSVVKRLMIALRMIMGQKSDNGSV